MITVIKDLFVDLCILNFFILLWGYNYRETTVNNDVRNRLGRIHIGLILGILGVLFMIYNIRISEAAPFLDLRVIALMVAQYIGGLQATIISGIIITIARVVFLGVNASSISAIFIIGLCIIAYMIIYKLVKTNKFRWLIMHCVSLMIQLPIFYYLMKDINNVWKVIATYVIAVSFSSILVYIMIEYVKSMNLIYKHFIEYSTIDYLTGLYNLRFFKEKLNIIKNSINNTEQSAVCIVLDIDYFKKINDTYGHPSGDLVLQQFAKILRENKWESAFISRIGGEEFCIFAPCSNDDVKEVLDTAEKIRVITKKSKFQIEGDKKINITVSIGVAIYEHSSEDLEQLVKIADEALYIAKNNGRDSVKVLSSKNVDYYYEKGKINPNKNYLKDREILFRENRVIEIL